MEIVAVAGLAQNFAALRSLVSSGIQKGHMKMHLLNLLNQHKADASQKAAAVKYFEQHNVSSQAVQDFLKAHTKNMKRFFKGKLLLTAEYFVLHGAQSLALPTRLGQHFEFQSKPQQNILNWTSGAPAPQLVSSEYSITAFGPAARLRCPKRKAIISNFRSPK